MVISLSLVVLVGIILVLMIRAGKMKAGPALVAALFGFLLASSDLAPNIRTSSTRSPAPSATSTLSRPLRPHSVAAWSGKRQTRGPARGSPGAGPSYVWSGRRESNPRSQFGRLGLYH